jgi:penicillin amidase
MKILRYVLLLLLVVIVLAAAGGFLLYNDWSRGPLPQHSGEIVLTSQSVDAGAQSVNIPGLKDTVEILRDEWGVPHIYASNTYDLFFAQGYTQAQDRWWQMEFFRHTGNGTLQELTGKTSSLMGTDVFIRTVGWRRAAEKDLAGYTPEVIGYLQAFADGVNAYILNRAPGDLAFEYNILGTFQGVKFEIQPWTPADSLVWGKVMAWDLSGNRAEELDRADLYEAIGKEMTDQWIREWPFGEKPTIIQPEDLPPSEASASLPTANLNTEYANSRFAGNVAPDTAFAFGSGEEIGSNNWVVSGELTESGKPLLANDPHLGIQMPSIWYEIGLHCQPVSEDCPFDVTGFALSPTPAVIIGHNARIAWGFTNVGPDIQDLYKLELNLENELQYRWNGEWRDMTVIEETIRFGDGEAPITIRVRETHLGPVINDNQIGDDGELLGFNNEDPMAFRWTALDPGTLFVAVLGINQASNWDEFRAALEDWDVPSQNAIYADVDGNIGYQTPGNIPIRAAGESGLVPSDCQSDECTWQGFIPFDMLPRIYNPERGYIATANQALVPLEYYDWLKEQLGSRYGEDANFVISQEWDYGYRGQRIVQLLEELAPHTIATFQQIQGDNRWVSAEEIMPFHASLEYSRDELNTARDWLLEWDFQQHMDSPQAALYAVFWMRLVDNLYNDQLTEDIHAGGGTQSQWTTNLLLVEPDNKWWDDAGTTDKVETRDEILMRAFEEAYDATVELLGTDKSKWKWGDLHTATFVSNPLGLSGISLIENVVNRGPVATSGGTAVNATGWDAREGNFVVQSLPSMRMIVDLSDLSQSVTMHTTGQSGHPSSEHYGDMIDSWRAIQYHPMLFTREQVTAGVANTLILKPG